MSAIARTLCGLIGAAVTAFVLVDTLRIYTQPNANVKPLEGLDQAEWIAMILLALFCTVRVRRSAQGVLFGALGLIQVLTGLNPWNPIVQPLWWAGVAWLCTAILAAAETPHPTVVWLQGIGAGFVGSLILVAVNLVAGPVVEPGVPPDAIVTSLQTFPVYVELALFLTLPHAVAGLGLIIGAQQLSRWRTARTSGTIGKIPPA